MSSDLEFMQYVADQIDDRCGVTFRKMFGEYALFANGKVVALVCDNQVFVKPTEPGRAYIEADGEVVEAPAYPGARPAFLIEEGLDDGPWLSRLIELTEQALPAPKPKKKRQTKKKKIKKPD